MKIRRAGAEDAEAIAALYGQLQEHHLRLAPNNPRYDLSPEEWLAQTRAALVGTDCRFYVSERALEVLGFVKLYFEPKPWGLACEVETLVVTKELRATGIGTALMRRAEEAAREEGALAMRVNVLHTNVDGRRFYERDGYRTIAVRYGKPL